MGNELSIPKAANFGPKELAKYAEYTFLDKEEIIEAWECFAAINLKAGRPHNSPIPGAEVLARLPSLRKNPFRRRVIRVFAKDGSVCPGRDPRLPDLSDEVFTACKHQHPSDDIRGRRQSLDEEINLESQSIADLVRAPESYYLEREFCPGTGSEGGCDWLCGTQIEFIHFLNLCSVFSVKATPGVKALYAFRIFDFDEDGCLNRYDLLRLVGRITCCSSNDELQRIVGRIFEEFGIKDCDSLSLFELNQILQMSPDFLTSFNMRILD
ncbi:hypothetical protein H696_00971 [Fonticula alba]|uniref:EF-hand domain-containing protein n=1 Tax=Fonticula alba TaxID=691883 RepID=A0A058ZGE1_FONAL|nr:hypothetical protein H696_00971 [Fonticula alba]KCV73434.1 hypothetical protein H696_00971 [Fonticula alba]|eukprot:XP_009493135.1 hypothetical protein H696_00971 [Fonticula alba]